MEDIAMREKFRPQQSFSTSAHCRPKNPDDDRRSSQTWSDPLVARHGPQSNTQAIPSLAAEHLKSATSLLSRRSHGRGRSYPDEMSSISTTNKLDTNRRRTYEAYILRMCRVLMQYGAPTHRLEAYMQRTAEALGIGLESFYLPGCMTMSFAGGAEVASHTHIVRCQETLNLAKLHDVHAVYKAVVHQELCPAEALNQLDEIVSRGDRWPVWFRILLYGIASMCFGPISYEARPVDLPIIFLLGTIVGYLELEVAPKSELYGYVFEMTAAILVSFAGRGFGTISWGGGSSFCFSAISQASIVLILPGYTITLSALESQTKNIVSGGVRMVYAIIYTLFLAFGFTIGATIYGAIDGNATSAFQCKDTWPFWWKVIFVIPYTVCFALLNQSSWKKMPPAIAVTMAGWVVQYFSAQRFASSTQLPQALGALTVGILANMYSRLRHGLAFAIMYPAIYIQVPGSFAASGSFISGLQTADQLNGRAANSNNMLTPNGTLSSSGTGRESAVLDAGYSMVEIAISITVGLSISALVVYPFRKKKRRSGLFSL